MPPLIRFCTRFCRRCVGTPPYEVKSTNLMSAGGSTPPSRLRRATSPKVEAICVSKNLIYTQNPPFREGFFFLPVPLSKTCAKGVKALSKLWQKVARQVPKHYI